MLVLTVRRESLEKLAETIGCLGPDGRKGLLVHAAREVLVRDSVELGTVVEVAVEETAPVVREQGGRQMGSGIGVWG